MRAHILPCCLAAGASLAPAQAATKPTHGDFVISNFSFESGETLEELNIHYQTMGKLEVYDDGRTNAVHIMHGSTGEGAQLLDEQFADSLFRKGQLLDAEKYFIILRDGIGHGESSNPRDTGLRMQLPSYNYHDMVRADYQLLTEHLGINHTRLVMGVSMGGMHSWMMGEMYPEFIDALMPIACLPVEIAGHNRLWRRTFMELIRLDPAWENGDYETQPVVSLLGAMGLLHVMFQGQVAMLRDYPTAEAVDSFFDQSIEGVLSHADNYDVNNQLYAWNASRDYNPEPDLHKITAPLTAVNTEDDLMNPPELGILENAIENGMTRGLGNAVIVPTSNETSGHASYIKADLWKNELKKLLEATETSPTPCE